MNWDSFWSKVDKTGECWIWKGSKLPSGYGRFGARPRNLYAHRAVWELTHGPIPAGMVICHHCDTPPCVNPKHLFCGTHKDNIADCIVKGRAATPDKTAHHGERNGNAKLSDEEVSKLREEYKSAPRGQRVRRGTLNRLSVKYGVSRHTVMNIGRGRSRAA